MNRAGAIIGGGRAKFFIAGAILFLLLLTLSHSHGFRLYSLIRSNPTIEIGLPSHATEHGFPKPTYAIPDLTKSNSQAGSKLGPANSKISNLRPVSPEFSITMTLPSSTNTAKSDSKLSDHIDFLPLSDARKLCSDRHFEIYKERSNSRKIYDLIMINTELDWLEIRLGQYYNFVDYFVIVEAAETFQGNKKPLYVQDNWDRFSSWHSKMIRHTLNTTGETFQDTWNRESLARNAGLDQVLPYLTGAQRTEINDVLLISDVDEIVRPDVLTTLRNCEIPSELTFMTHIYYYSFQWVHQDYWPHPHATLYQGPSDTIKPDVLRHSMTNLLYNAGWHCSYCFSTLKEMVDKVTSFSHHELNRPEFRDPDKILERVRSGKDFFDREESVFWRVEDNADVPEVLKADPVKYAWALDRDPEGANFEDYRKKD